MSPDFNKVSIATIGDGSAEEQFQRELTTIAANIADPASDWRAARKLTMTFIFRPNMERQCSDVEIKTATKLAPPRSSSSAVTLVNEDGHIAVYQSVGRQGTLDLDDIDVAPAGKRGRRKS